METNDILSLMEKYNLTLRRLSDTESISYIPRMEEIDKANSECVSFVDISLEKYNNFVSTGMHILKPERDKFVSYADDPEHGVVIRKMINKTKPRTPGWLVKIDNGHGSMQMWSRDKGDFFGETAQEAVEKAVAFIENKKKERAALMARLDMKH